MSSGNKSIRIEGIGTISQRSRRDTFEPSPLRSISVVNLLSVRFLILDNYKVSFLKNSFEIHHHEDLKMKGLYIGNLTSLSFENFKPSCFLSSSELLQKSLGHISYSKLRKSLGIPLKIEKTCESCAVSIITRASFKSNHRPASKILE